MNTKTLIVSLKITITLLVTHSLIACSSVQVSKQSVAQSLINERHNIITNGQLSNSTLAGLRIAGVDEERCFTYFDDCISQVSDSINEINSKTSLALFSELYYAKSRQLISSKQCNWQKKSKLIDLNQKIQQEQKELSCLLAYQDNLNTAIRYSFAYLFYNQLANPLNSQSNSQSSHKLDNKVTHPKMSLASTHITNEQDIQTLDIYQVSSNEMMSNLYKSSQQVSKNLDKNRVKKQPNHLLSKQSNEKLNKHADIGFNERLNIQSYLQSAVTLTPSSELQRQMSELINPNGQINAMQVSLANSHINVYLPSQLYLQGANSNTPPQNNIENLVHTSEIRLSGLNSISKRQGFGLSYIAQLKDRYTNNIETFINEADNTDTSLEQHIHGIGQGLLSGYVQPKGTTLEQVLTGTDLDVHFHNPYAEETVHILGQDYPLAANFSAGYALWLSENNLHSTGFANMLDIREKSTLPKLFRLEPYNPNKRVIIMVHGLASSPATWVGVTNDIFNDQKLRDSYQVWQIFYPTNIPMIENRYHIQKLIETAFQQVDPNRAHIASQHSVMISHSMGGILTRMMLSNRDLTEKLKQLSTPKSFSQYKTVEELNTKELLLSAYSQNEVRERFQLQRLPQVDRAVFINAPFRGTDFADRWFTRALRRIIQLPVGVSKTIYGNLSSIVKLEGLRDDPLGALFLQNGASQLSNQSSFMQLTNDLKMDEDVTYHTIIASQDNDIIKGIQDYQQDKGKLRNDNPKKEKEQQLASIKQTSKVDVTGKLNHNLTKNMSDGIVPYSSSHLDGAKSETIISGGHSVHANPKTILVLRNILHEHLKTHPLTKETVNQNSVIQGHIESDVRASRQAVETTIN